MNQSTKRERVKTLRECLQGVQDPRMERTRDHHFIDILIIGVCCLICGGTGFTDMETFGKAQYEWLRRFLALPNGIPSHDTFTRVFSAINPTSATDGVFLRKLLVNDLKPQKVATTRGVKALAVLG